MPGSDLRMDGPTLLLVNSQARSGAKQFRAAEQLLRSRGVAVDEAVAESHPERIPERVKSAVRSGVRRILAGGGDGTFSAIAHVLAKTEVPLGLLPLGTGNDFARGLGIPLELESACDLIALGHELQVDLGRVDGRYFLNALSIGFTPGMTRRLSRTLKRLGPAGYLLAAASAVATHRPFEVKVIIEGRTLRLRVLQLVVGNGRYHGGGLLIAPDATLRDGMLDLYAIGAQSLEGEGDPSSLRWRDLWTLARVGARLRAGKHVEDPSVQHVRSASVRLEALPRQEVDVDGELYGETPIDVELVPRALKVLVGPRSGFSAELAR